MEMKQGMNLMELGTAALAATVLIERAISQARDMSSAEAALLLEHTTRMQCQALEIQRKAVAESIKAEG